MSSVRKLLLLACVLAAGAAAGGPAAAPASEGSGAGGVVAAAATTNESSSPWDPERQKWIQAPIPGSAWGDWTAHTCEAGAFVIGYSQRVEPSQGMRGDDTALNAVCMWCSDQKKGCPPNQGPWGTWSGWVRCSQGACVVGYKIRSERGQGPGDDTAANGVLMKCSDGEQIDAGNSGPWGAWSAWATCPHGWKAVGIKTQVEPGQGDGDDTSMGDMMMLCES